MHYCGKDLLITTMIGESGYKVKAIALLDVVVLQRAAVLELLAGEDETLLVWRDALPTLDLGLDGVDGVTGLDLNGDGLAGQCLHEDLHVAVTGLSLAQPEASLVMVLEFFSGGARPSSPALLD